MFPPLWTSSQRLKGFLHFLFPEKMHFVSKVRGGGSATPRRETLPKTRVNYWCGCEFLWRAKKSYCVEVCFSGLCDCFFVCGCCWLPGSKSTSVCLHKDNLVPLLDDVVFKFKVLAWAATVKCLQIVSLNIYYKLCYLWVFSTALFNVRLKSGKVFCDFFFSVFNYNFRWRIW